jgi:hypothetical protein
MLHKCANPACPSVFRSLSHGKLFLLEIDRAAESTSGPFPLSRLRFRSLPGIHMSQPRI